nr:primosomal protein N' [Actinopolymorpha cephalotaxi]
MVRGKVRKPRAASPQQPAPELPVARVLVDVPLAHLDRPFDYLVPERIHATCVPGARVRVRFAGQDLDGFVLERVAESDHRGRLMPLRRVVSAEPVLAPEIARLARRVADRYAGTLADVLRLAVPPRHARVEGATAKATGTPAAGSADSGDSAGSAASVSAASGTARSTESVDAAGAPGGEAAGPGDGTQASGEDSLAGHDGGIRPGPWSAYQTGVAFIEALRRGDAPRAVWTAVPGEDWPAALAHAAAATLAGGKGVLVVVPDQRDVARLDAAFGAVLGPDRHVVLTAELGPAERYRRFLAVRRGTVRCVVGTRSAAFAPVADLGLVACWDDGDDLHAEPRAPYPHVREVLLLRAHETGCAALLGGFACTAEGAHLLTTGWARPLVPERAVVRERGPRVVVAGDNDTDLARDPAARAVRLPHRAFEQARTALSSGPVLVQVPRSGYLPALACQTCRGPARCATCAGPLQLGSAGAPPSCGWCGRPAVSWRCPTCGGGRLRAPVVGAGRTAEELGRAFPRVPVRTSGGPRVLSTVGAEPALVVATPGAEPVAEGGYAGALLLDSWLALARADLRAGEEALRRWLNAAALVRPARAGGSVVVVGDPGSPALQALVRWSPQDQAARELAEREAARFPPAVRLATLTGAPDAVRDLARLVELPPGTEELGPVPLAAEDEVVRLVLRVRWTDGARLSAALKAAQAVRSARKAPGPVRVQVDPAVLG